MIAVWGIYTALTTTDVLVLQQFRPADEVAHYYAASKTLTLVTFVYFAVAASAAHRFAAYHVAGDRDGLESFVVVTIRWIFWPSLVAMLAIGLYLLSLIGAIRIFHWVVLLLITWTALHWTWLARHPKV